MILAILNNMIDSFLLPPIDLLQEQSSLRSALGSKELINTASSLVFPVGRNTDGVLTVADFRATGHFISSGHVGSGHASYDESAFVLSLLFRYTSDDLKLVLIDPKRVQLTPYEGIPHLLTPIAQDPESAERAVNLVLEEMDRRFELLANAEASNIEQYNRIKSKLPNIVIVATEIADLMMVDRSFYEKAFIALSQKAKAVGIHMYLATQRPSKDVITDMLLANIFGRIVFAVASETDSMRLLNSKGAERLSAAGTLLYGDLTTKDTVQLQAPYVSDEEVMKTVEYLKERI
jgi:S-DNA-T family DNA segregation ATPase FtsK/SpoIIIE